MRADNGVRAHHAVRFRGEVHGAAFAAHQAVVALHQFAQHFLHGNAARQRVGMTAIGAERVVALLHGTSKARRHRLLAERQMAGALDQVLEEQVERALLGFADHYLGAVHRQALFFADVIVQIGAGSSRRPVLNPCHALPRKLNSGRKLAPMN